MKADKYILFSIVTIILLVLYLYQIEIINMIIMLFIFISIVAFHSYLYFYIRKLELEFKNLNGAIESILEGNHDTRVISTNFEDNRVLNANINRIAKRIEKMSFKNDEDEQTIQILTNNITSLIIYIDIDGKVRYVNNQFINKLDVQIFKNDLYEKIPIRKIYRFIDDAFTFETNQIETLRIKEFYFQANAIPITNNLNRFVGILFIFHDITDIKKYEKLQREFLADASHELKTPISAIKGASEILLNGPHDEETTKDFLNMIHRENDRMEKIVRDILLISRIESENLIIKTVKIDLKPLIDEVVETLSIRYKSKYQTIYIDIENELYIKGDYERIKQVFINLISNAISYTNEGKNIYIKGYHVKEGIIVKVIDEGIGIAKNELPHIFERFYRIDKARARDTGGTGLGLPIVKSTLDVHKATIEVSSEENKGTTFKIQFKKY